jgi:hypothetical protein
MNSPRNPPRESRLAKIREAKAALEAEPKALAAETQAKLAEREHNMRETGMGDGMGDVVDSVD